MLLSALGTAIENHKGTARSRSLVGAAALALGSIYCNPAAANDKRTRKDQEAPEECALVVRDRFEPPKEGPAHGDLVVASAESIGLAGRVVEAQLDKSQGIKAIRADTPHSVTLSRADASEEEARQALDALIVGQFVGFLDGKAAEVKHTQGFRHSVLNLSHGRDPAGIVKSLYFGFRQAWASKTEKFRAMSKRKLVNTARVLNVDPTKILSEDPKVHGPERQKLQQALIDRVAHIGDTSPQVKAAVARWESAVDRFEADKNSVVIAAGNSARVDDWLIADNGGHPLTFPPNSQTSLLETEAVTSVGAIRDYGGIEKIAVYSSRSLGVDVWVDGDIITDQYAAQGTSFSAPKAATIMTDIHCDNKGFGSDQVEATMVQELGRPLRPDSTGATVIDLEVARQRFQ